MKQTLDRIYEAYMGDMGDSFAQSVRERIHWMCKEAKGDKIYDVGCSQGIVSILLAREGSTVLGLDLQPDSIKFAEGLLEDESPAVKDNTKFVTGNFINHEVDGDSFDSIILGEVLEHTINPTAFLSKANALLKPSGRLVLTVPFGINEFIDHKRTYYLMEIIDEVEKYFTIQKIKFFGKWLGVVATKEKKYKDAGIIDKALLYECENNFYLIESDLLSKVKEKVKTIELLKEKCKQTEMQLKVMQEEINLLKSEAANSAVRSADFKGELGHRGPPHINV